MVFASFLEWPLVKTLLRLLGPTVSVCDVETWRPNTEMMENCAFTIQSCADYANVKCLLILCVQVIMYNLK